MDGAGGGGEEVRPHYLHNFYTQLPFTANTEAQRGTYLSKIQACRGPCASRQRFSPGGRCPGLLASSGRGPPLPVAQGLPYLAALMPIWKSSCRYNCCWEAGSFSDQEHAHVKGPGLCNLSQILESRVFIFLKHVRGEQMMPSI